ncbi:UNVERIFIED_CONTAM: Ninja-family protein [Sesamum radiatum]|uniref:Ninja-family protein n=1 Tax=Sesamum radiatum TaxID=300843 RepID=A0AAW2LAL7_SESRA
MATEVPDAYSVYLANMAVIPHKSPESTQFDGRAAEHGKSYGKQQVAEEGSSSHTEGDLKGSNAIHQGKDASDQPRAESTPSEFPAIRPGPNGRTISGVTYRYSPTQIRIVCACHGSHMSPEEFVRHAGEENSTPDAAGAGLASIPSSNTAASAQS